jgi:hypothetical protein
VTDRARSDTSRLALGVVSALLAACLVLAEVAHAQAPAQPVVVAGASGPSWSALTPAQQSALAPLKKDWSDIDAMRKQKWLEIAARLPSLPPDERQRIQERMTEWARMTPEERGRARLQFQEARQISPHERQARWDAYMALPVEERRALANSARTVPKAGATGVRGPAGEPLTPASADSARKSNIVAAPSPAAAKTAAPTLVQAKPGASTTLISKTASPPAHVQAGQPKISAGPDVVNRRTMLPQTGPQSTAAAASAAP